MGECTESPARTTLMSTITGSTDRQRRHLGLQPRRRGPDPDRRSHHRSLSKDRTSRQRHGDGIDRLDRAAPLVQPGQRQVALTTRTNWERSRRSTRDLVTQSDLHGQRGSGLRDRRHQLTSWTKRLRRESGTPIIGGRSLRPLPRRLRSLTVHATQPDAVLGAVYPWFGSPQW